MTRPTHTRPGPFDPGQVTMIRVFVQEQDTSGGNPVPLVADARGMDAHQMQAVAQKYGYESAFIFPPADPENTLHLRYFVPAHEMEMCGHATVGALWAMRQWGLWTAMDARVETASGIVHGHWDEQRGCVWISQPRAQIVQLDRTLRHKVLAVLGVSDKVDSASDLIINSSTSRFKTLIAMPDVGKLNALEPAFAEVESLCDAIGSTGLYPYALEVTSSRRNIIHARQFPRASGYPEDAATGIAASALWGSLVEAQIICAGTPQNPAVTTVIQGVAMGSPSAIQVLPGFNANGDVDGCWLSGKVKWNTDY